MPQLPPNFTFIYNGVTITTYSNFSASMEPIRDEASRTVTCLHFVIKADATVTTMNAPDTDTTLLTIQRMLSEDGGRLTIQGLGLGNMDINAPGGNMWDVNWGPKCTMGEWTPLGGNLAAQVPITIETWVVMCEHGVSQREVMAFNYEIEWSVSDGLTTRTISGYLEIPITRWNGQQSRTVPDTAEQYADLIQFEVPLGFRRRPIRRTLSNDRKRLTFSIVDEEIESDLSPPVGAISIEAEQRVRNEIKYSDVVWVGSIRTAVRGARNSRPSDVMAAVVLDIKERLKKVVEGQNPNGGTPAGLLIRFWEFWERWYSREFGIDIQYQFVGTLETIIKQAGFWTAIPSSNWTAWRTDMGSVFSIRGSAGLTYHPEDDRIIDICSAEHPMINQPPPEEPQKRAGTLEELLKGTKPKPEESWIHYNNDLIHSRNESTAVHKYSQAVEPMMIPGPLEWLKGDSTNPPRIGVPFGEDDVIQSLSTPGYRVRMVGTAMRAVYPIDKPGLLRVNGADVFKHGMDVYICQPIAHTPYGPVWRAVWGIDYATKNSPTPELSTTPNHEHFIPHTFPTSP